MLKIINNLIMIFKIFFFVLNVLNKIIMATFLNILNKIISATFKKS